MATRRFASLLMLTGALVLAPVAAQAEEARELRSDIVIARDSQFDAEHGVRSGSGTLDDPFVISNWDVSRLSITDTSKAVRIENNTVRSTMTLNWIGHDVAVEHNDVGDLRVNENRARWGAPTGGHIMENTFDLVGQLRHFDGMFMHNTIGSPGGLIDELFDQRAVNFDGFNGAEFAHNTIYGYMDARLHGHHHSSGYDAPSHGHNDPEEAVDHSDRWHQVFIHDNHITTTNWYALAYLDTNHAANDRTAASETNPELNAPHVHHTRVRLTDNHLHGGGIMVDVFNAKDELHTSLEPGEMFIERNQITLDHGPLYPFEARSGIEVRQARGLALSIADNTVGAPAPSLPTQSVIRGLETSGAGVSLDGLDQAQVTIAGLSVTNRWYGVQARSLTDTVTWSISGLVTEGVDEPVWYDSNSVSNAPTQG